MNVRLLPVKNLVVLPETQFYEVCFSIVIRTGSQFKRVSLYSEVLPHYSNAVIQNSFIRLSVLLVYFLY